MGLTLAQPVGIIKRIAEYFYVFVEDFMPNPFDPSYVTIASVAFGPFEWVFFLLQFFVTGVGVYFAFMRSDSNALRKQLLSKLGTALLIVGGIGIIVGGLRLGNVSVFTQPFWFYIVLVAEIAVAGYAAYYARAIYPSQLRNSQTSRGKSSSKQQVASNPAVASNGAGEAGESSTERQAQQPQRSRRDARRERKRRKK